MMHFSMNGVNARHQEQMKRRRTVTMLLVGIAAGQRWRLGRRAIVAAALVIVAAIAGFFAGRQ